jgi:hypothetical protein
LMDGWDGLMDEINEWVEGLIKELEFMYGWNNGRDGWIDRWMEGMDG